MRSRRLAVAGLVAAVATALSLLAGCTPDPSDRTDTPTPRATPLFASDEEALAAATEAYQRYLDVSAQVGQSGWSDLSPLESVESHLALRDEMSSARRANSLGYRQVGRVNASIGSLQANEGSRGRATVTVYACLDAADFDVIDRSGASTIGESRPPVTPFELQFRDDKSPGKLKLSRSEPWSGENFC